MNSLMSIGVKALMINQKQMEVTGHNIANINTPGYSRQRIIQSSGIPISDHIGSIGTGVYAQRIERVRDEMLEMQFRQQQTNSGYWNTYSRRLNELEKTLNEPSIFGLGERLNDFWNSWDALSTNPGSIVHRRDLIEKTNNMILGFREIDAHLKDKRNLLNMDLSNAAYRVNEISSELAHLTKLIQEAEFSGNPAGDLRDRFDFLIDELSYYGNVRVETRDDQSMVIYLGSDELIKHGEFRKLTLVDKSDQYLEKGVKQIVWSDNFKAVNGLNNGEIAGILKLRDDVLVNYHQTIDKLAVELATNVNLVHNRGFNISDPPSRGYNFFSESTTGAGNISISADIMSNPARISAGIDPVEGDNRIALEIANLRYSAIFDNRYTYNEFYSHFLNGIGNDSAYAKNNLEYFEMAKMQADNFRESVKGVSMDEEAANLLRYQKAFQAAAKIIQMSDNLMTTVIGLVR